MRDRRKRVIGRSAGPLVRLREMPSREAFEEDLESKELRDPTWIQVFATGTWHHPMAGEIAFDEAFRLGVVEEFNAAGRPRPIDVNHAGLFAMSYEDGAAYGWMTQLEDRGDGEDGGVWALTEWLDRGRNAVRSGDYRYISPEFELDHVDKRTGKPAGSPKLSAAALTNRPFLETMTAAAASEGAAIGGCSVATIKMGAALAAALEDALAAKAETTDSTREDLEAELAELAGGADALAGIMSGETECPTLALIEAMAATLDADPAALRAAAEEDGCTYEAAEPDQAELAEPPAQADGRLEMAERRAEKAEALLAAMEEAKKEAALTRALDAGRVLPVQMRALRKLAVACRTSAELERELDNAFPAVQLREAQPAQVGAPMASTKDAPLTSDEMAVCRLLRLSEATWRGYGRISRAFFDGTVELADGSRVALSDVVEVS